MKRFFSSILLLSAVILLSTGCNREEKKARNIGYRYAYAMSNYQIDEAAQYATEETKNTTLVMAKRLTQAVGEAYVKSDTPAKVKITGFTFENDTSAVITFHKTTPIKNLDFPLLMRKRNGQWMVHDTIPVRKDVEEPDINDSSAIRQFIVPKK